MPTHHSLFNRSKTLEDSKGTTYDLLVIGGGITGAGIALEAGKAGLKTLLLEKTDFAHATSSRSSKMIHGGLRYLENFQFHVVKESLRGRKELLKQASHLVSPMTFLFPVYKGDPVGPIKLGLGLTLYDKFAGKDNLQAHRKISLRELQNDYPLIKIEGFKGAFQYQDAITDDARLVIETLRSALLTNNVSVLNHAEALEVKSPTTENPLSEITWRETLSGSEQTLHKNLAQTVILAGGPWTDRLTRILDFSVNEKYLLPSKGIHILVKSEKLPVKTAVVLTEPEHHRILFVVPRYGFTLVGTTESPYTEDPACVFPTREEVDYLKNRIQDFFPNVLIQDNDILSSYAGVRPLAKEPGSHESTEGKASREHVIKELRPNLFLIAGGKYTTYRLMSQEIIQKVFLSQKKKAPFYSDLDLNPLLPWNSEDALLQLRKSLSSKSKEIGVPEKTLTDWTFFYGAETQTLIDWILKDPSLKQPLNPSDPHCIWNLAHVRFAVELEEALTLNDVIFRRLNTFYHSSGDQALNAHLLINDFMKNLLGWSEERTQSEKESFLEIRKKENAWRDLS